MVEEKINPGEKRLVKLENGREFTFTQTLQELDIIIQWNENIRGRDVKVINKKDSLAISIKDEEIMSGELFASVIVDECTWTLEEQKNVFVHLSKQNQMQWWPCVLKGQPEIDVTKIQPENSKLGDLDGETRAMVEKMMFDQRQKEMGKPTSEELQKKEMLQKFMKQHPELKFEA